MNSTILKAILTGAIAAVVLASPVRSQEYPTRPVRIMVPLAAGTAMDGIARVYAEELSKSLGKPVIVENQPGAAMMLAAQTVATAAPDGHTLLVSSAPVMTVNPTLYAKVNYDVEKDFTPIALYARSPFVLIANPALGLKSVKELVEKAKASSAAPLNYGTPGAGTLQFLAMESLAKHAGIPLTHAPYRNTPQILTDLMGGHVAAAIHEAGAATALIKDGKLTALAVTSVTRLSALPDVPSLAEAAGMAGFDAVSWHVLAAPAATPTPILEKLNAEMRRITSDPDFQKKVVDRGLDPLPPRSIAEMKAYIRSERERWGGVVRAMGLAGSQ